LKKPNIKEALSELVINGERQLFFIGFLLLVLLFKYFPGSEFVNFRDMLISIVKPIKIANFSLFETLNIIGSNQIPICKFLIFLSICGWSLFALWFLVILRFDINDNIHHLLGVSARRMGVLCTNFYVIYNLLIVIFANGYFLMFDSGFWKSALIVTSLGYLWAIGSYFVSNIDKPWEKPKQTPTAPRVSP
jgi:hypothetical protein